MSFLPITNIKFHANLRFWAPSQHRNCAAVLQGEVSIVDQVFHNPPPMCKDGWKSFWYHIWAHHGPQCVVSANNKSQISCKISVFGYPPSKGDAMPCYKERHPLLIDCFILFLKYIRMVGRATGSIDESLMVHNMSFLPVTNIKFHTNLRFWAHSQHRKCAAILQGEVSIVDEVFHNLPQMCKDDWKSFW